MRMCSIASGSSGNCIYAGSEHTHIIVDAGISAKRIEEGLNRMELTSSELSGIVITHEHSDHIKSLGVLARRYHLPMYATMETICAIQSMASLGSYDFELFHEIRPKQRFMIGDMSLLPLPVSHDAANPVCYRIEHEQSAMAVVTDLGCYDEELISELKELDVLLLESNHDVKMLEAGRYSYPLKRRILGKKGHLSNESAGRLLEKLLHDGLKTIFLGHLSKENNLAELAYEAVRLEITMGKSPYRGDDFKIITARRDMPELPVCF